MTETIEDRYGWNSLETRNYHRRAGLWCVVHRERYATAWSTAGPCYFCQGCEDDLQARRDTTL